MRKVTSLKLALLCLFFLALRLLGPEADLTVTGPKDLIVKSGKAKLQKDYSKRPSNGPEFVFFAISGPPAVTASVAVFQETFASSTGPRYIWVWAQAPPA